MWEVMRRAGESLLGLWALIAGLAEGVRDPEGYICLYVSLSNFYIFFELPEFALNFSLEGSCGIWRVHRDILKFFFSLFD